jgi:mycothiol system anti-sigma-R factor
MSDNSTAADALGHHRGTCDEALATLYHFLDGELTPERRQAIQHHLEECSPCLGKFDFEAELKLVVAIRCRDQVPEHLRQRVAAILAQASGSSRPLSGGDPSGRGGGVEE